MGLRVLKRSPLLLQVESGKHCKYFINSSLEQRIELTRRKSIVSRTIGSRYRPKNVAEDIAVRIELKDSFSSCDAYSPEYPLAPNAALASQSPDDGLHLKVVVTRAGHSSCLRARAWTCSSPRRTKSYFFVSQRFGHRLIKAGVIVQAAVGAGAWNVAGLRLVVRTLPRATSVKKQSGLC